MVYYFQQGVVIGYYFIICSFCHRLRLVNKLNSFQPKITPFLLMRWRQRHIKFLYFPKTMSAGTGNAESFNSTATMPLLIRTQAEDATGTFHQFAIEEAPMCVGMGFFPEKPMMANAVANWLYWDASNLSIDQLKLVSWGKGKEKKVNDLVWPQNQGWNYRTKPYYLIHHDIKVRTEMDKREESWNKCQIMNNYCSYHFPIANIIRISGNTRKNIIWIISSSTSMRTPEFTESSVVSPSAPNRKETHYHSLPQNSARTRLPIVQESDSLVTYIIYQLGIPIDMMERTRIQLPKSY